MSGSGRVWPTKFGFGSFLHFFGSGWVIFYAHNYCTHNSGQLSEDSTTGPVGKGRCSDLRSSDKRGSAVFRNPISLISKVYDKAEVWKYEEKLKLCNSYMKCSWQKEDTNVSTRIMSVRISYVGFDLTNLPGDDTLWLDDFPECRRRFKKAREEDEEDSFPLPALKCTDRPLALPLPPPLAPWGPCDPPGLPPTGPAASRPASPLAASRSMEEVEP